MTRAAALTCAPGCPLSAPSEYRRLVPALGHSGINLRRFFMMHLTGAIFPLTAGIVFFGWRAGLTILAVIASMLAGAFMWKKIGLRGRQLNYNHLLWVGLLLSLMLPAHLAAHLEMNLSSVWPILPLAGLLLAAFCWLLGGVGLGRIHPVLVTYLVLAVMYGPFLTPSHVLQRNCMVLGDLVNAPQTIPSVLAPEAWYHRPKEKANDAISEPAASETLQAYTTAQVSPDRAWLSLEALLRDRLPPLEDLILGAAPGPIGTSSGIAVIIGGLFLLYRQLIDYRIPLLIVLSAMVMLLILPVPSVITDKPQWHWMVGREAGVGWSMAVTFANYEILGSPLLFTAFFLATAPAIRPLTRRGRGLYAIMVGILAAIFQLYVSVSFGSYLGLLGASMLTPAIDKWIRPHALV